MDCSAIHLV